MGPRMKNATFGLLALLAAAPALAQTTGGGTPVQLVPPSRTAAPGAIVTQPLGPPEPAPATTATPAIVAPAVGSPYTAPPAPADDGVPGPNELPGRVIPPGAYVPPEAPVDRALNAGSLTVTPAGDSGPLMPIVADNGFPFDVRLSVETVDCRHVVAADCGPVVRDRLVAAGTRQTVYTVRRQDVTRPSYVGVRFEWAPANLTPMADTPAPAPSPPAGN